MSYPEEGMVLANTSVGMTPNIDETNPLGYSLVSFVNAKKVDDNEC